MNKIFLLIVLIISNSAYSQINSEKSEFKIFSEFLKDSVNVQLRLPREIEKNKDSLSMVLLLDGSEYFGFASDIANLYEFGKLTPKLVIVSLPSTMESRWTYYTPTSAKKESNYSNSDDLYKRTGKFNEYSLFVQEELIPFVEKKLNIKFNSKTIFGHSLGGLGGLSFFTLKPNIFDNYIIASPSSLFDEFYIIKEIEKIKKYSFSKLYLSVAENDMNGYLQNTEYINETISKNKTDKNKLEYMLYKNQSHAEVGLQTLLDGLKYIYKN